MSHDPSKDTVPHPGDIGAESSQQLVSARRFSWWLRGVVGGLGISLIVLLAVAAWLDPDPRQFGTHQQLGLPGCTIMVVYGVPCPSCGMTTSWAWMMNGQPLRSWQANAGGATLAIISLVAGPWLLVSAVRNRWWGGPLNEWLVLTISMVIVIVTLIDWSWRIWFI